MRRQASIRWRPQQQERVLSSAIRCKFVLFAAALNSADIRRLLAGKNRTLATDVWSFGAVLLDPICGADEVKSVAGAMAALQSKAVTVDGLSVHADVVSAGELSDR